SGQLGHILKGHRNQVRGAAFSPDGGSSITTSLDHSARVWFLYATLFRSVLEHDRVVRSSAFSPDGKHIVTASDDKTARVWDAQTEIGRTARRESTAPVRAAVFSTNER